MSAHSKLLLRRWFFRSGNFPHVVKLPINLVGLIILILRFQAIAQPGECARIFTGAPIPDGATAVVMQEDTQTLGDWRVRITDAGRQALADQGELAQSMSDAALKRVQSIGGWDQYGDTMYRVFTELLSS